MRGDPVLRASWILCSSQSATPSSAVTKLFSPTSAGLLDLQKYHERKYKMVASTGSEKVKEFQSGQKETQLNGQVSFAAVSNSFHVWENYFVTEFV